MKLLILAGFAISLGAVEIHGTLIGMVLLYTAFVTRHLTED